MNEVKDFTVDQRVTGPQGSGVVVKLGRKYVHVLIDGTDKPVQILPAEIGPEPEVSVQRPAVGRPMRRVDRGRRRAARLMQRASRRANRKR